MYQWEISLIGRANTLHVFGSCSIQLFPSAPSSLWQFRSNDIHIMPDMQTRTMNIYTLSSVVLLRKRRIVVPPSLAQANVTVQALGKVYYVNAQVGWVTTTRMHEHIQSPLGGSVQRGKEVELGGLREVC